MIFKLSIKHLGDELYNIYESGMTLIYLNARSSQVASAFEWGKLIKCNYISGGGGNLLGVCKTTKDLCL